MRRLGGTSAWWAIVLLCFLLVPAAASASDPRVPPTYIAFKSERFSTGGYEVSLDADRFSGAGGERGLSISVRRGDREQGHGDRVKTSYSPVSSRPRISGTRIRAKLGSRGSVGMRFRARDREIKRFGCERKVVDRGVLVGHFRFRGEAGYLEVLERRIGARRIRYRQGRCSGIAGGGKPQPTPVLLGACRRNSVFGARELPGGREDFVAFGDYTLNRGLFRFTVAVIGGAAGEDRFSFSDDLGSASVQPPRPFRGTGLFDGAERRLEGDLRASFFATKRIRFAPASAKLVRRNSVTCDAESFGLDLRAADARDDALRLAGADWLAGPR